MEQSVRARIVRLLLDHKRHVRYLGVLACLALIVSLGVVRALRQDGVAMTHQETYLDCPYTGSGAHTHNADCYDESGTLVCPLPERELHTHDDSCFDEEGNLVCGLEEVTEEHVHGPGCFATVTVVDEPEPEIAPEPEPDPEVTPEATDPEEVIEDATQEEALDPVTQAKLTYEDDSLTVEALVSDAAGIPEDATLVVTPVTSHTRGYNYDAYMEALQENDDKVIYDADNTLLYDVAVMVGATEWEPVDGSVELILKFRDAQLTDQLGVTEADQLNIVHLPLKDSVRGRFDSTKDATNISARDIVPEAVDATVASGIDGLTFEVDSLSIIALNNSGSTVNVTLNLDGLADTNSMSLRSKNTYAYLWPVDANGNIIKSATGYGKKLTFTDSKMVECSIENVPQGTYKLILAYATDDRQLPELANNQPLGWDVTRYAEDGGYFFGFVYREPTSLVNVSDATYAVSAQLNLADLPDSLDGVGLSQIMDRAINYAITADEYVNHQQSFANIAVKKADVTNQNAGGGNYFGPRAGDIVVPYIIADLTSDYDPNSPDEAKRLHSGDKQTNFYVTEKDADKVVSADNSNTVLRDKNEIEDRVEIMISNTLKMAERLANNTATAIPKLETVDFSAYPDNMTINLDADALDNLDRNFTIIKRPGQTVIFNFSGEYPVPPMNIVVKEIDDNGNVTGTYTAGDSMRDAPASDGEVWNKIIWNFPNAKVVNTRNDIGGIFISPGDFNVNKGGGWIVSGGTVSIQNPWYGFPSADEPFKQKIITKTFTGLEPGDTIDSNYILHLQTHINESTSGTTHERLIADLVVKSKDDAYLTDEQVGYESMEVSSDGTVVISWKTPPLSVGNEHKLTEENSASTQNAQVDLVEFQGPYSYWSDAETDYVWEIRERSFASEADFNEGDGIFNVSARDSKDGQDRLHVFVTNHYKVDKTPRTLTLSKTVVDPEGLQQEGQEYTFEVSLKDEHGDTLADQAIRYTLNGGEEQTVSVVGGKATVRLKDRDTLAFVELPYGTQYTIVETNLPAKCEVELTGDTTSKTEATGRLIKDRSVTATNTFSDDPGVPITAHKQLIGGVLRDGQFTYRLVDANGTLVKQVTNDATGNITFGTLVFEQDGVYDYTLYEVADPEMEDIVFDPTEFGVHLRVKGGRVREVVYSENGVTTSTVPMFTNKKLPPDTGELTASKVFIDRATGKALELKGGDFTFTATASDGTVYTGTNDADGVVVFKDENGHEVDVNSFTQSTTLTIAETAGSYEGTVPADHELAYDSSRHTATVEVTNHVIDRDPWKATQNGADKAEVMIALVPDDTTGTTYYMKSLDEGLNWIKAQSTKADDNTVIFNIEIPKNLTGENASFRPYKFEFGKGSQYNNPEPLGTITITAKGGRWGVDPIEVSNVTVSGGSLIPSQVVEKTVSLTYADGHHPVFRNYLDAVEPDTTDFSFTKVWVDNATYANPQVWQNGQEISLTLTGAFEPLDGSASSITRAYQFGVKRTENAGGEPTFEITQPTGDDAPQLEVAPTSGGAGHYAFVIKSLPDTETVDEVEGKWSYTLKEGALEGYQVSYGTWDDVADKAVPQGSLDETGISDGGYLINAKISVALPAAGGVGTHLYTIAGVLVIACAVVVALAKRKQARR